MSVRQHALLCTSSTAAAAALTVAMTAAAAAVAIDVEVAGAIVSAVRGTVMVAVGIDHRGSGCQFIEAPASAPPAQG